jgi:hypothetical protein
VRLNMMNEVAEFVSNNQDMGEEFQEFASRYSSFSELWRDCPDSRWMLLILRKRYYCNSEKLERYIDWLSEQIDDVNATQLAEIRRQYFSYKGCVSQFKKDVDARKVSLSEATFRRFICTWNIAFDASLYVIKDRVETTQFNNATAPVVFAGLGEEFQNPPFDEVELKRAMLKDQADKLREVIGNPFMYAGLDDFCYDRDIRRERFFGQTWLFGQD